MYIHKQNLELTIFFTASYSGKEKYQKEYDLVRKTIQSFSGITVISPELGNYKDFVPENIREKIQDDPQLFHYEAIKYGISKADAVIIEASQEDFQLGHEATLAMMGKKPVLVVSVNRDFSERIHNEYFFGAKYSEENIKGVIQDFLAHVHELSLSKRFNLFLYPQQYEYLEDTAKKNNMNISEYIRKLINLDKKVGDKE